MLSYLTNDDGKVSTLKEKFDPNFESENPGTTYINNNPNLRACGSGMYAQAKPPGTVVNATWAHPKITYPD